MEASHTSGEANSIWFNFNTYNIFILLPIRVLEAELKKKKVMSAILL